ncbi:hypothetical protein AB8B21_30160 [Tardiphaga sp. 866_E4_N2_1]|jgi:hypothetical protein|uniref:hypothetical protein n=1 Tax=unclassified Tardiphaga TaxID=2631404 RepID=UPI003F22C1CB
MSLNPIDLAALSHALDIARKHPKEAERIDGKLAKEGGDWLALATSAAFHCQMSALNLLPWQSPPMFAHIERPSRDEHAAELLQRMLDAGLSRYESDPVAALERSEAGKAREKTRGARKKPPNADPDFWL